MAVVEHPDMPSSIGGIQGLNLWNILILNVTAAWITRRHREGYELGIPKVLGRLGFLYLAIIVVGFFRLVADPANITDYSTLSAVSEYLINAIKWVVPGIILMDGARSEQRVKIAVASLLSVYFLLAVQVLRWIPLSYATSGDQLSARASKLIQNEIGYNRVTLSIMLAGASWAIVASIPFLEKRYHKFIALGCAGLVVVGQALTAGRTGYVAWGAVGIFLCLIKWRRVLPLIPVVGLILISFVPAVRERMLSGVATQEGVVVASTDDYEMTSGRTLIWPFVIEKIKESPLFGHGKLGMIRTGLSKYLEEEHNELFAHPHNAYMEALLDNGIVGFVVIVPFYLLLLKRSLSVFLRADDPIANVTGGIASALLLALLIGALGGQTFYPREGSVAMWAAIGLVLRVSVDRERQEQESPILAEEGELVPSAA